MLTLTTLEAINVSRNPLPRVAGRRYIDRDPSFGGREYLCTYSKANGDGEPTSFLSQPFRKVNIWEPGE